MGPLRFPGRPDKWWLNPLWDLGGRIKGGAQHAGGRVADAFMGLGETEEARRARLHQYWLDKRNKDWAAQTKGIPSGLNQPYDQVMLDKQRFMVGQDPNLEMNRALGYATEKVKDDPDKGKDSWKEISNMLMLKSIADAMQAERPTYVSATRAGSTVSPARSLMTAPMRGGQGNQRDLLNYIYGGV
jgi:hypothetical protein|tara:strand:+ start:3105 stop:3662 length:558 start_codon:yes stop_codon:yes gene_type:complete